MGAGALAMMTPPTCFVDFSCLNCPFVWHGMISPYSTDLVPTMASQRNEVFVRVKNLRNGRMNLSLCAYGFVPLYTSDTAWRFSSTARQCPIFYCLFLAVNSQEKISCDAFFDLWEKVNNHMTKRPKRVDHNPWSAQVEQGCGVCMERFVLPAADLGGGTFDVSLLTIDDGFFEVVATRDILFS